MSYVVSHKYCFKARLETTIAEFLYRVICWTPRCHAGSINQNFTLFSTSLQIFDASGLQFSLPQRLSNLIMLLFGARACIQIVLHPLGISLLHLHTTAESGISLAVDAISSVIASNLGSTCELLAPPSQTLARHRPIMQATLAFGDQFPQLGCTCTCYSISTHLHLAMWGPLSA